MYFVEKLFPDYFLNNSDIPDDFDKEQSLFFDIETSGLSPKKSIVILIGIMFFKNNNLILRQYFAETPSEEPNILNNFCEDLSYYKYIYNYNGTSFDIHFLKERFLKNNIVYDLSKHNNMDIYKAIASNKDILKLKSTKLKSIEKYLNINRTDELSGKEIVEQYKLYLNTHNSTIRDKILLHNQEDVVNLYRILPILNTIENKKKLLDIDILKYDITITKSKVIITGTVKFNSTDDITINKECLSFNYNLKTNQFNLIFKVTVQELYYVFKDYKNYYYFPKQDQAIHKSLAKYYKHQQKVPAKKTNCYTKVLADFISLPFVINDDLFKACSINPNTPPSFISLDELAKHIKTDNTKNIITDTIKKIIS